jgi:hypothetical protein
MGWSHSGNTRQKYQHYYADDSFDAVLTMMDGLALSTRVGQKNKKDQLKPKQCPNCDESNKPESKFCSKCRYVLSYDGQHEIEAEAEKRRKELEQLTEYQRRFEERIQKTMSSMLKVITGQSDTIEIHVDENDPETMKAMENLIDRKKINKNN